MQETNSNRGPCREGGKGQIVESPIYHITSPEVTVGKREPLNGFKQDSNTLILVI